MNEEVSFEVETPSIPVDYENMRTKESLVQKFVDLMRSKNADIRFIFEDADDIVKLPAHKEILAASSPTFDAMFNGDLKEEGDVRIVDVSAAAFEEFLQFFYGNQVHLTLDNISEVLYLIEKYDVAKFRSICADFLKLHLTIDDILWGLDLAIKYHLCDLKEYCMSEIQKNHQNVFALFMFDEYGNGKVCKSANKRLLEIDLDNIFPHVFSISRNIIATLCDRIDRLQEKRNFFFIPLSTGERNTDQRLTNNETTIFSVNDHMLLTDIFCSKIYTYNYSLREYETATSVFDVLIEEKPDFFGWDSKAMYTTQIVIDDGQNHIKLLSPIMIRPNFFYAITFKSEIRDQGSFYTYKANIPSKNFSLAPGVDVSFPQTNHKHSYSLISQLYFAHFIDS